MDTDVLVIGCGIAGASAALELAVDRERSIAVITRADSAHLSNSGLAQGGIVGRGEDDREEDLVEDVLRAGAGISYPPAVEVLVEEGPALLQQILVDRVGVRFDRDADGRLQLGLEAAHSRRRVLHVGDHTGKAIMDVLLEALGSKPNVTLLDGHTAVDLLTYPHHARDPLAVYEPTRCHGAYVLCPETGKIVPIVARATVLATGGLGQIFLNTSNPVGSRGDGLAMAYRAGARIVNAEYVQFHPTTLQMPGATKFLISEAVRGEGGVLLTADGRPFVELDPDWRDLAARDVVARGIYQVMLANGDTHALLDIASHRPADFIRRRFPTIHERCLEQNIDITRQPVPVVPAAHYACGGALVDLWGRTSLAGLWAAGEVACTGVHGANRIASTSLLEGLVWGTRSGRDIRTSGGDVAVRAADVPPWSEAGLEFDADPALIQGDLQTIRNLMWHYVGLVRSENRLDRAAKELDHLRANIEDFYRRARLTDGLIGLRNAAQVALIVTRAAQRNRTSRGCHYREERSAVRPGDRASRTARG